MKDEVLRILQRTGFAAEIGLENLFPVKTRAVGAIYRKLDSEICRHCTARIFRECHTSLPNGEPRAAA